MWLLVRSPTASSVHFPNRDFRPRRENADPPVAAIGYNFRMPSHPDGSHQVPRTPSIVNHQTCFTAGLNARDFFSNPVQFCTSASGSGSHSPEPARESKSACRPVKCRRASRRNDRRGKFQSHETAISSDVPRPAGPGPATHAINLGKTRSIFYVCEFRPARHSRHLPVLKACAL